MGADALFGESWCIPHQFRVQLSSWRLADMRFLLRPKEACITIGLISLFQTVLYWKGNIMHAPRAAHVRVSEIGQICILPCECAYILFGTEIEVTGFRQGGETLLRVQDIIVLFPAV